MLWCVNLLIQDSLRVSGSPSLRLYLWWLLRRFSHLMGYISVVCFVWCVSLRNWWTRNTSSWAYTLTFRHILKSSAIDKQLVHVERPKRCINFYRRSNHAWDRDSLDQSIYFSIFCPLLLLIVMHRSCWPEATHGRITPSSIRYDTVRDIYVCTWWMIMVIRYTFIL